MRRSVIVLAALVGLGALAVRLASGAAGPTGATGATGSSGVAKPNPVLFGRVYWPGETRYIRYNDERPPELQLSFRGTGNSVNFIAIGTSGQGSIVRSDPPIAWSTWGSAKATGVAHAELLRLNCSLDRCSQAVAVRLAMTGIAPCGGVHIYTRLTVTLAPGENPPTDWNANRLAGVMRARCWPNDGCPPDQRTCALRPLYSAIGNLPWPTVVGGKRLEFFTPFSARGKIAVWQLSDWGRSTSIGEGFLAAPGTIYGGCDYEVKQCQAYVYPLRYTYTRPRWCPAQSLGDVNVPAGLDYTTVRAALYGSGTAVAPGVVAPAPAEAAKLLSEIGENGIRTLTATSSVRCP